MVICLSRSGAAANWIARDDVSIVELHKRPGNDLGLIGRLAKALKRHGVDIVHSHNWGTLVETALARRWAGVPAHVHAERGTLLGDLHGGGWRGRLRASAARWAMNRADCVVTVAETLREKLAGRCGRLRAPVRVIPNGVDAPPVTMTEAGLAEVRKSLGVPTHAILLGSVGRLAPVKGFGDAVNALLQLRSQGANVHLMLVGEGPERDALAWRARELGIEPFVHLVGSKADVGNWLAVMDVYVNASLGEGMSQSILEAMAVGLPLVATEVGDSPVLVNGRGRCGVAVPPGNPAAIATAVARLLEAPALRREFSQAARARHARYYSTRTMIGAYERLYSDLRSSRCATGSSRE